MHRPPAVTHRVDRSLWQLRLLLSLSLLGAGVCVLLLANLTGSIERLAGLLVPLAALCLAVWDWKRSPRGLLQWDGQQWLWSGFGEHPVHAITLALDFQHLLVVKIRAENRPGVWLWLETPVIDRNWLAVRRAVFASRAKNTSKNQPEDLTGLGVVP